MAHAKATTESALELTERELRALRVRFQPGVVLSAEDCELIQALVVTLEHITQQLGQKNASIARLRVLLFGPHSEKIKDLFPKPDPEVKSPPSSSGPEKPAETGAESTSSESSSASPLPCPDRRGTSAG